jgi:hypothetical protein
VGVVVAAQEVGALVAVDASEVWQDRAGSARDRRLRPRRLYLADPQWILQVGDTTLIPAGRTTNVVRRGDDGSWRYTISLLDR